MRTFDRDELGDDPEDDDEEETGEICPDCLQPLEDCECEDEEE